MTFAFADSATRKNCQRVTPKAFAMRSMDEIDGEHWPFSICERKLGETSVLAARARNDTPCFSRKARRDSTRLSSNIVAIPLELPGAGKVACPALRETAA